MKTLEEFVMWALNNGCITISDVKKKLTKYGFEEDEIHTSILKLESNDDIIVFRSGKIGF